ncbi:helix-turn-helix transcriptional regulator [Cohnella ginsengisoli]|uniref:Helix-turn-helix transcriptional regulator n=1 Tax=Cohnella ginsengisoli TaxID=425004 RepID=A0A9X4QMH6_9BACL|nr:helix-turn-helix transcriptional regulator [Cohnella ginsengisoli]MDG0791227.1 helix-turn-helix transcriptional regulator [Cohnella ginsengisoli]
MSINSSWRSPASRPLLTGSGSLGRTPCARRSATSTQTTPRWSDNRSWPPSRACPSTTFFRTFSRYVGQTPNDYLNRVRIERSVELLGRTDWSIEAIASAVGYSSGSYFIKVFRRLTGQTPGQYREGRQLPYSRLFYDS